VGGVGVLRIPSIPTAPSPVVVVGAKEWFSPAVRIGLWEKNRP
jgi:hypothetical protein